MRKCAVCVKEKDDEHFLIHARGRRKICRECPGGTGKIGGADKTPSSPKVISRGDKIPKHGRSVPPTNPSIPGDDLFYLADAVKMVADQLVEVTKNLGKIRADLNKLVIELQKQTLPHVTVSTPPPRTPMTTTIPGSVQV